MICYLKALLQSLVKHPVSSFSPEVLKIVNCLTPPLGKQHRYQLLTPRTQHSVLQSLTPAVLPAHPAGYWAVDAAAETALGGSWKKGPGLKLFDAIKAKLGKIPILAEDLGVITTDVVDLRYRPTHLSTH